MTTQLDKLFFKGLSIPLLKDWGRQIAAETSSLSRHTYVLHTVTPTDYNIVRLFNRSVTGAVRVTLKGVVYIAGPMRNYYLNNFPMFDAARDRLIGAGYFVFSPADMDRASGFTETSTVFPPFFLREAFDRDCNAICRSTHIYLLPEWEESSGVRLEAVLGDALEDITFITGNDLNEVPSHAVCAVIGGRLVARYQKGLVNN